MPKDSNAISGEEGIGSEEGFSVEQGRTPTFTYTIHQDWCDLMPISHGAARMHRILRSMMTENKGGPANPTRVLSMDRLCWIMSSFQEKPVGEQTIRDYRRELVDAGMVDVLPGAKRNAPPRYVIHDVPPEGWRGWRNAWEVDDSYVPGWRSQPPEPKVKSGQTTPRITGGTEVQSGHKTPRPVVPHGSQGGTPRHTVVPTCPDLAFGASKEVVKESLSLAGHTGSPRAPHGESERTPSGTTAAPQLLTPREAAQRASKRLNGSFGGRVREDIVTGLTGAIENGLPPSRAVACLNGMLGEDVHSPGRVHRANLETLIDADEKDRSQWLLELCTGCDERGATDVEVFAVRPGSSVCLHGQRKPTGSPGLTKCITCTRMILSDSAEQCGRCCRINA